MASSSAPYIDEEMSRILEAQAVPFEKNLAAFVATEIDPELFMIMGSEFSEVVEIRIPPNFIISSEPGTMIHMDAGLAAGVDIGDCCQGCKRCCCAGESCFRLNFHNTDPSQPRILALSGRIPSKIVPINLARHPGGVFFRAGGFLAALGKDWTISLKLTNCSTGCCGGMGFVLNRITGSSWVFLSAGGTVMQKQLEAGESIIVDEKSILAFEHTVKLDVVLSGNASTVCCGGMGLTNSRLTGPGFVLIESMSLSKLRFGLMSHA